MLGLRHVHAIGRPVGRSLARLPLPPITCSKKPQSQSKKKKAKPYVRKQQASQRQQQPLPERPSSPSAGQTFDSAGFDSMSAEEKRVRGM